MNEVLQFKVTLLNVKPSIWRRIQVPKYYSFWDLHVAIQDVFGWTDTHIHEFNVINPKNGMKVCLSIQPDEFAIFGIETLPEWKCLLSRYVSDGRNKKFEYIYDPGDHWRHKIEYEGIVHLERKLDLPICIAGRNACPPEDVGGGSGYEKFLQALADPAHEEHESYKEWIAGSFDPKDFSPGDVGFDDPKERWKQTIDDLPERDPS